MAKYIQKRRKLKHLPYGSNVGEAGQNKYKFNIKKYNF